MFSIDRYSWPWPCDVERVSEMKPSKISGLMLDKNYFNDVLGTYMSYTVSIAVPPERRDEYTPLYECLTDPSDGHVFTLPYNQGTIQDVVVRQRGRQAVLRRCGCVYQDDRHRKGIPRFEVAELRAGGGSDAFQRTGVRVPGGGHDG